MSSDPEFVLNMLCMREIEGNGEVMKPKESEGDEMGNNNELRDNGKDGGMDVDSVPRSDNIPAFDGCSSGITEDISRDKPVDIYQKFSTDNMIQLILRETNLYGDQYVDSRINFLQQHPRAMAHSFIRCKFTA